LRDQPIKQQSIFSFIFKIEMMKAHSTPRNNNFFGNFLKF